MGLRGNLGIVSGDSTLMLVFPLFLPRLLCFQTSCSSFWSLAVPGQGNPASSTSLLRTNVSVLVNLFAWDWNYKLYTLLSAGMLSYLFMIFMWNQTEMMRWIVWEHKPSQQEIILNRQILKHDTHCCLTVSLSQSHKTSHVSLTLLCLVSF